MLEPDRFGVEVQVQEFPDGLHAFAQFFMLDMAADAVKRISAFARARVAWRAA